jgi:hypothetical protein
MGQIVSHYGVVEKVGGVDETGNQAFSLRLRFLTIRDRGCVARLGQDHLAGNGADFLLGGLRLNQGQIPLNSLVACSA